MNLPLLDQKVAIARTPASELAGSFERRRLRSYLGLMIADVCVLFAAFFLAGLIYVGRRTAMISVILPAELLLPIYLTIALQNGTYSLASLKDWRAGALRAIGALADRRRRCSISSSSSSS